MKKLCHFIATTCILATPFFTLAKDRHRIKIKPSFGVSLNKRSLSVDVDNTYYISSLSNSGSTLVSNFSTAPFGTVMVDNSFYIYPAYAYDSYLGPGYSYITDEFVLKKTGIALADATSDDAILGSSIKLGKVSSANAGYLDLNTADGQTLIPIASIDEVSPTTTMKFRDLSAFSGEVTTKTLKNGGSHSVSYIITNAKKLLKIDPASGDFSDGLEKYYDLDGDNKYHIILGSATANNNFHSLISDIFSDAPDLATYTQTDYEYVDYLGVSLGVVIEAALSDSVFFNMKGDLTTPVEKIEHTGKFIALKPEADLSLKVGLSYGNENGSVGFLYGAFYDRFSAQVKRLVGRTTTETVPVLKSTLSEIKEFTTSYELTANIHLTPQMDAYMSTTITSDDYKIQLADLASQANATNQKFLLGVSINYQD